MTIVVAHTVYTHATVTRICPVRGYGCTHTHCTSKSASVACSCVTFSHDTCVHRGTNNTDIERGRPRTSRHICTERRRCKRTRLHSACVRVGVAQDRPARSQAVARSHGAVPPVDTHTRTTRATPRCTQHTHASHTGIPGSTRRPRLQRLPGSSRRAQGTAQSLANSGSLSIARPSYRHTGGGVGECARGAQAGPNQPQLLARRDEMLRRGL